MTPGNGRPAPVTWQLARLAAAGSSRQAFLDRRWIRWLLRATPPGYRRGFALRLLSLSPHYFIYQWDRYPSDWDRSRILDAEHERNRHSRRQIADRLLAPVLPPQASVLDFGCGPGFLAGDVSARVSSVIGLDISSGTLACAAALNPGPSYRCLHGEQLPVEDASIDLVYSIAVFQHIDPGDWPRYFHEFHRVLRPGGTGLCHFAIADSDPVSYEQPTGPRALYSLRFQESTTEQVLGVLGRAGFAEIEVRPMEAVAAIDDDVGRSHIATFCKPA